MLSKQTSNMEIRQVTVVIFHFTLVSTVSAQLTVQPSNTVAVLGQSRTEFKCSTIGVHNTIADWWWVPYGRSELIPIFQSHTLVYLYENHMEVELGPSGQYDLVIHNVTFSDAGRYTCFDDGRLQSAVDNGHFASAELVVIDTNLNCTSNMSSDGVLGSDICDLRLQPDYIGSTCSIQYRGNIAPSLEWDGPGFIHVGSKVRHMEKHSLITSEAASQANERMNGSFFSCSVTMKWNNATRSNEYRQLIITWNSSEINLLFIDRLHISESVNESKINSALATEIKCFVPTNLHCEYKWTHPSQSIVILSDILKPSQVANSHGIYQCSVYCKVRERTCSFNASTYLRNDVTTLTRLTDSPKTLKNEDISILQHNLYVTIVMLCILGILYIFLILALISLVRHRQVSNNFRSNNKDAILLDSPFEGKTVMERKNSFNGKNLNTLL